MKPPPSITLTVISQSVLPQHGPTVYLSEGWASYIHDCLSPHFARTILVAPTMENGNQPWQTVALDPAAIEIMRLPVLDRRASGRRGFAAGRSLKVLFNAVQAADLVWLLLPSRRSLAAGLLCRWLRRPYVAYIGGDLADQTAHHKEMASALTLRLESWVVRRAAFVLVAGKKLRNRYAAVNPRTYERRPATHLRKEDIAWRADSILDPAAPLHCLYVGAIRPGKGVLDLIRAISQLRNSGVEATLTLVGARPRPEARQLDGLLADLHLADVVAQTGHVPNGPSLWEYYRRANIFVIASHPNYGEGFPRVIYEAMAHGLPVVTTAAGGIAGDMAHEANCLIVPPGQPAAIAGALQRLWRDGELRRLLIANAYQTVSAVLAVSPEQQVTQLLREYGLASK